MSDGKPVASWRLYGFLDTAYLAGRSPAEVARGLCEGGVDIIQLRAKGMAESEVRRMTEAVLPVTRGMGVPLLLNDHLGLAIKLGADGCHLGQEDFFGAGMRNVAELKPSGRQFVIGLSTHSPEQAKRALEAKPDYIAIGPVYATGTKPGAKAVTLNYVRWAREHVTLPWFAIGGITMDTLAGVLDAGADRVCVVSAILNAAKVTEACQEFKRRILSGR